LSWQQRSGKKPDQAIHHFPEHDKTGLAPVLSFMEGLKLVNVIGQARDAAIN
jgi:hypothetical protein